jgi:hypothetical protein
MTHLYQPTQNEIDHAAEEMTLAYTKDTKRIERAAQLLTAGAVDYMSNGIGWSVASQRNATTTQDPQDPEPLAYNVTSQSCGCYDHLNRSAARGQCGDQTVTVRPACKHIYAMQMYIKIIAAKLDGAMKAPFSGVYGIETSTANVFAVYDRLTDVCICGAVYSLRSDTYRPQTGQDAADFARWLYAQPAEFFAGGMLEQILRNAPGDAVTLKATVIYGSERQYTLTGYRYESRVWALLDDRDRQDFTPESFAKTLVTCGWIQPGAPVKQAGLSYHYMLMRGTNATEHHGLTVATAEYVVNRKLAERFEREINGAQ